MHFHRDSQSIADWTAPSSGGAPHIPSDGAAPRAKVLRQHHAERLPGLGSKGQTGGSTQCPWVVTPWGGHRERNCRSPPPCKCQVPGVGHARGGRGVGPRSCRGPRAHQPLTRLAGSAGRQRTPANPLHAVINRNVAGPAVAPQVAKLLYGLPHAKPAEAGVARDTKTIMIMSPDGAQGSKHIL